MAESLALSEIIQDMELDTNSTMSLDPLIFNNLTTMITSAITSDMYSDSTAFFNETTIFTTTSKTTITTNNTVPNNNNMTLEQIVAYIQHLQDEEFLIYLPALCFIALLAFLGFFGNILVLLVYKSKFHRTPTRIFIMAIALFDLIANVICVPGDVYDMFHLWDYSYPVLCRLVRYANASTTITSACILLALSITRYKKICRPFGKQVSTWHAKVMCVTIAIFGWSASIPFCILNGIHKRPAPQYDVTGIECSIADEYTGTIWPLANNGFFLLLFLGMCVPLVVLYTLIGVKAYKHSKIHGQPMVNTKASTTVTATHTLSTEDALDNPKPGVLSRFFNSKKNKQYNVTRSEILDSNDSAAFNPNADVKDCDAGTHSETCESADLMGGKTGTPVDSEQENRKRSLTVRFVRQLSGAKTDVNFSMVRELTIKLKNIKQDDKKPKNQEEEEGSGNELETKDDMLETCAIESENVHGQNEQSENDVQCGAKDHSCDSVDITTDLATESNDKTNSNLPEIEETKSERSADDESDEHENNKTNEAEGTGLASRLQWIDFAYCNDTRNGDDNATGTMPKKTSLSRKVSRENSLLRKQRTIREALIEKLRKSRMSVKDDDDDDDDEDQYGDDNNGDSVTDMTKYGGEEITESKMKQINKSRRNSQLATAITNTVDNDQQSNSNTKIGAAKKSIGGGKSSGNPRGSVINRTTAMLILITSVYVLSYVPYLILIFFRFTQPHSYQSMDSASTATHHLFLRTYFVNSAANAFIYSLCDYKFRKAAVNLFRCRR